MNAKKWMALTMGFMLMLVGCGGGGGTADNGSNAAGETKEATTTYTVKHAMGETPITGTPKKVVVLTNEGTEALLELGVKPVGAVRSFGGDPWYPHIAKEMEGVQNLGDEDQPSIEQIAALQPDLIIGNKMRQEKIYEQLKAIAPTVFSETLRGEWKNNFKLYAEALNKKTEGDKVLADWDKKIADFKTTYANKLSTQVSLVRFMPGKTRIYYNQTFAGMILNELGVARPEAQKKDGFADDVTKERIPEMEGDVMFYYTYNPKGQGTQVEQEWTNDPMFKNLNVVKSGRAFKVDDNIWNTSGGVISANTMIDQLGEYMAKL